MRRLVSAYLMVITALAAALFFASFAYFKSQDLQKAEARLTLYRSTVDATLEHFAHLPFLLSLDPVVIATLQGADVAPLNKRLARFSQSAGIDAIYLMDTSGRTIAASNAKSSASFVGQNYGYRPYFQAAMQGELGEFYGIGATTGIPGYFYAMAVRPEGAGIQGVVAIKLDLSELQDSWQVAGENIILSNADGVVLLASDPSWRYRALAPLNTQDRARILEARQFAAENLAPLDWSANLARQTAQLEGERYLYVHTADLPNSWSLHFFAPDDGVLTRALLTAGGMVMLSGLLLLGWQVRRVRQIGAALARSEKEEMALRRANDRLAVEIEDRRAAERTLQKTQAELERAGRLAALGQLASSVTHELGQPIAAMRNQLAAAEMSSGTTILGTKMTALVHRMEDITRQLKFFSRKGRDQFETVDLRDVIADALELIAPNIDAAGVNLQFSPPSDPVHLTGNKLRLEQVVTNLVRNAVDAVESSDRREVHVAIEDTSQSIGFSVTDTGSGLGGQALDDLREPFATSKESGKGMGLGLTISAGIVADHGGTLSAQDGPERGAVFRASFPRSAQGAN